MYADGILLSNLLGNGIANGTNYAPRWSMVDPEELMRYVAERVAPHKKVRLVEFVDEIPKAASGKILRRVLMERDRQAAG